MLSHIITDGSFFCYLIKNIINLKASKVNPFFLSGFFFHLRRRKSFVCLKNVIAAANVPKLPVLPVLPKQFRDGTSPYFSSLSF